MIRQIDPDDFPDIVAKGNPRLHENLAFYATEDNRVLGVVVRDRVDDDFSWVVLGEDPAEAPGKRCVNMGASLPTQEAATEKLHAEMENYWTETR